MSPPDALSPTGGKIQVGEIPPVAESRGPNSNALAHAEHAMLTLTCAFITFLLVDQIYSFFVQLLRDHA